MKRFVFAVCFCVFLLLCGFAVFLPPTAVAEKNLLQHLLDLPAPPPANPLIGSRRRSFSMNAPDRNRPPADDVPIEDLLAYWQAMNQYNRKTSYAPQPSTRAFERLRGELENKPELLPGLLNALPDTEEAAAFVKNLYERELSEKKFERDWRESVKYWLLYHSDYFSEDLLRTAREASDTGEYVTNQDELLALARVDWEKARPILDRFINDATQPNLQTLARWAFYRRAVQEKNSGDTERYRRELQATVEDKAAKPGNRDLAMDALVESGDFAGRDEWYYTLLEDETLHDLRVGGTSYTGLTTLVNHSPPEKYTAKMLELVKSGNPAQRSAAIRNLAALLDGKNPEVIRALLPWLENPDWASQITNERQQIVSALREMTMPESVPGLIAMLNEKPSPPAASPSLTGNFNGSVVVNSNAATTTNTGLTMTNTAMTSRADYYPFRDAAIGALATQKDPRAIPALRLLLPQVEEWQRGQIVRALLASGGFSVPEQIEALETVAGNYARGADAKTGDAAANVWAPNGNYAPVARSFDQAEWKTLLGMQLVSQSDAAEDLVAALVDRIAFLDQKDAGLATALRRIAANWNGAAVNRLLLRDLKSNRADADAIIKLLSLRKSLRENQFADVSDARGGTPTALGITACLLENASEYDALLAGDDLAAKTAMLACARLVRAVLPVAKVAENLKSPNKTLATAAERYLAAEDSPEARAIVLALHPNEAVVLGARTFFAADAAADGGGGNNNNPHLPALFASVNESSPSESYYIFGGDTGDLRAVEKRLRAEVKSHQELLGVYAYDDHYVRIYRDRAVFSWQEDPARYRERVLEAAEFDNLKNYLAAEGAADLPPFVSECADECRPKELLMLGRGGGRRVFTLTDGTPKFFAGLERIFAEMREPPAKLHYWLEKEMSGLEILYENANLAVETVWKNGADTRVLLSDAARRKAADEEIERLEEADEQVAEPDYEKIERTRRERRQAREFENYSWSRIVDGRAAGAAEQPNGFELPPKNDGAGVRAVPDQWKARAQRFELRVDEEGLYKVAGGRAAKIADGYFEQPALAPNGRWAAAVTFGEEGTRLVRINLTTNKQFVVEFPEYPRVEPVVFIAPLNRLLLLARTYTGEGGEYEAKAADVNGQGGDFYLLDLETGARQKVSGEVRPLVQQTYRPLQTTGSSADEFWAAIPNRPANETQVGVYNARTLRFKPLVKIPKIVFDSMQMWVDAGKIYFVYQGHLLALPLPK